MKRFIALLLSIIMVFSCLTACSSKHFSFDHDSEGNEYITKAEWAEILGTYFGMDSCLSDKSYYSDISSSNPSFAFIQSCVEWEVFSTNEKKFKPDDYATIEFVVDTAVKASEVKLKSGTSGLDYAAQNGISTKDKKSYATKKYALSVIEWAYKEYENLEFVEYENVEFKEDIIDLTNYRCDNSGVLSIPNNNNELKVGDVIITSPTANDPSGVARKITNITVNSNGETVIETTEPEIGDIYEELDFAYVGTVTDPSIVQTPEGVKLNNVSPVAMSNQFEKPQIVTLAYRNDESNNVQQLANKGTNLSFSVKVAKGGKITFSPAYNSIKADIEKGDNSEALKLFEKTGYAQLDDLKVAGDTQTVKATDKYTSGWEIEGSLALKNFYVETELKTKKAFGVPYGIDSFDYEIHYEVDSSLKFSGKLEEEVTIATVPIPLGGTGITIDVEIFAKASVTGDIEISASISNTSTVKYSSKNGYKKTQSSQCDRSLELSVNFKVGFGGKATLKALGIKLIDFKLDVGVGFEASAKVTKVMRVEGGIYKYDGATAQIEGLAEETFLCIDGTAYFPTVSLSLGTSSGTLANKLGIKFTWKIMDKSGATFKSQTLSLHFEIGKGLVDECSIDTYEIITEEDVESELEKDREENANKVGIEVMDISKYALSLEVGEKAELSISVLPYGYVGHDVTWKSEDETIVSVQDFCVSEKEASCKVVAKGPGVTFITVNTNDGKHPLKCSVTVKDSGEIEYTPID